VVGEREDGDARGRGRLDDGCGLQLAVRDRRVRLKLDQNVITW
jgi:hypothetical protein